MVTIIYQFRCFYNKVNDWHVFLHQFTGLLIQDRINNQSPCSTPCLEWVNSKNLRAKVSHSFSHHALVGQKTRTPCPRSTVSRHKANTCSPSSGEIKVAGISRWIIRSWSRIWNKRLQWFLEKILQVYS